MKLNYTNAATLITLAASSVKAVDHIAVFKFGNEQQQQLQHSEQIPILSQTDSILNLADEFDISSYYKIESADSLESLSVGKSNGLESQEINKMILIINGVDHPSEFFSFQQPIFQIESKDDRHFAQFKSFLAEFPSKLMTLDSDLKLSKLSEQINLVGYSVNSVLSNLWNRYFHSQETNKLESFWIDLKDSFSMSASSSTVDKAQKRSLNHINDEEFINELTQLDFFLRETLATTQEKVIINLNSLITIFKKTGVDSQTYNACKNIVSELISSHLQSSNRPANIETTVVVLPIAQQSLTLKFKESASKEAMSLRKRDFSSNIFASGSGCYSSQETCIDSTSSCSAHGLCTKIGQCWKCVCSTTIDSESGRTSYWVGSACQKQDISSQFNLLFWTTLSIILAFAAGIKLLVECGSEELPGVLVAATTATKKAA